MTTERHLNSTEHSATQYTQMERQWAEFHTTRCLRRLLSKGTSPQSHQVPPIPYTCPLENHHHSHTTRLPRLQRQILDCASHNRSITRSTFRQLTHARTHCSERTTAEQDAKTSRLQFPPPRTALVRTWLNSWYACTGIEASNGGLHGVKSSKTRRMTTANQMRQSRAAPIRLFNNRARTHTGAAKNSLRRSRPAAARSVP